MTKYRVRFYMLEDCLNYLDFVTCEEARISAKNFIKSGRQGTAIIYEINERIIEQYISPKLVEV